MSKFSVAIILLCSLASTLVPDAAAFPDPPTTSLVDVYIFPGATSGPPNYTNANGDIPVGGLIRGDDGDFYGTTRLCGPGGKGTVYKVTPAGDLTTLHGFSGPDGKNPNGLIQGGDGNFYGTTSGGGTGGRGTIYRVSKTGTTAILHNFTADEAGRLPAIEYFYLYHSGLVQGAGGFFYGTTQGGGANHAGSVFKFTQNGGVSTLHSFSSQTGGDEGSHPAAPLTLGADGAFFGTTKVGGRYGFGTAFKITSAGVFTNLHSFTSDEGIYPTNPLLLASDGNFYGTTFGFDLGATTPSTHGSVYRMTSAGVVTRLSNFYGSGPNGTSDSQPYGRLIQATDGNLYGTSVSGGNLGTAEGSIFRVTLGGVLTQVRQFEFSVQGESPQGGLAEGAGGSLYGASTGSGPGGAANGGIFKLGFAPTYLSFDAAHGEVDSLGYLLVNVNERVGKFRVAVHRSGPGRDAVSVICATEEFSAGAQPGRDYRYSGVVLKWAEGDISDKIFTVPILDRGLHDDSSASFAVNLSDPTGDVVMVRPTHVLVTIYASASPTVMLTPIVTDSVAGSGRAAKIRLSLPSPQNFDVDVFYHVKGGAVAGTDYAALSGIARIRAGRKSQLLKIHALGDLNGAKHKKLKIVFVPDSGYKLDGTAMVKVRLLAPPQ